MIGCAICGQRLATSTTRKPNPEVRDRRVVKAVLRCLNYQEAFEGRGRSSRLSAGSKTTGAPDARTRVRVAGKLSLHQDNSLSMVVLSRKLLLDNRTEKGGFTRRQVEALGITWPPSEPWIRHIDGKEITDDQWANFLAGRVKVPKAPKASSRATTSRMKNYLEYLDSPHWKQLKGEKRKLLGGKFCEVCGDRDGTIHGHHIRYKDLIDCTTDDIVFLCEDCHKDLHRAAKWKRLDLIGVEVAECVTLIKAYRNGPKSRPPNPQKELKRQFKHRRRLFRAAIHSASGFQYTVEAMKQCVVELNKVIDQLTNDPNHPIAITAPGQREFL